MKLRTKPKVLEDFWILFELFIHAIKTIGQPLWVFLFVESSCKVSGFDIQPKSSLRNRQAIALEFFSDRDFPSNMDFATYIKYIRPSCINKSSNFTP